MRNLGIIVALTLALSSVAWPHGNMDHILGKVVKVNGNIVSVENDGKTMEVSVNDSTTYEYAGHADKMVDLRVGDRVVIHAVKLDGKEVAHEVRFTHSAK